jgi:hypothetical protein
MKCGNCKRDHATVAQVKACASILHGGCKHGLDFGTCIACAAWNKRRGTRSFKAQKPVDWGWELGQSGLCSTCNLPTFVGETIFTRTGQKRWSHRFCFCDPGAVLAEEPQKSQREPDPEFRGDGRLERLMSAAEDLLAEAIAEEEATTILLLQQVAADMDYDLSIDLIRETIYGYSLEQLGAWEPIDAETEEWEELASLMERQSQTAWGA